MVACLVKKEIMLGGEKIHFIDKTQVIIAVTQEKFHLFQICMGL